jgi:hypothetical protein
MGVEAVPAFLAHFPAIIGNLFGSAATCGGLVAIVLNLIIPEEKPLPLRRQGVTMIALNHFNQLEPDAAMALLQPCVALPGWAAALVAARPFASLAALHHTAKALTNPGEAPNWNRR